MRFFIILCFLALPLIGCANKSDKSKSSDNQAQEMQSNLWVVNPMQRSCIQFPGGDLEELVAGLQQETGEVCQVILDDVENEPVRTVFCGDMNTGKAWIVTESEEMCQTIIQAYQNINQENPDPSPVNIPQT